MNDLIDKALIINLAKRAQGFILRRVQAGEYFPDINSDEAVSNSYSTRPMPIPYGKFIKLFGKTMTKRDRTIKSKGEIVASTSSNEFVIRKINGKAMVIIKGGYKRFREMSKKESSYVTEHWSGRMMRNLGIVNVTKESAEIGFSSSEEKQKAIWQHIGAGKNKITHIFMKLTKKEAEELTTTATQIIIQRLNG